MIIERSYAYNVQGLSNHRSLDQSQLQNQVLFLTIMPNQRYIPRTANGALNVLEQITDNIHHQIVRHSVNRYQKPSTYNNHPITLYFFEPEGARTKDKANLFFLNNPHIHCIIILNNEFSIQKMSSEKNFTDLEESIGKMPQVDSFHLEWFDDMKGNLTELVDYCGKYAFDMDRTNKLPSPPYGIIDPKLVGFGNDYE